MASQVILVMGSHKAVSQYPLVFCQKPKADILETHLDRLSIVALSEAVSVGCIYPGRILWSRHLEPLSRGRHSSVHMLV